MIDYWLDVILCCMTVVLELIGVFGLAMLIQLISYQCFGINIYQRIIKRLNRLDKYFNEIF